MREGTLLLRAAWFIIATFIATSVLGVPTSAPATQAADTPLPAGAICRLGESRFSPLESADFSTIDFSPDGTRVITAGYQPRIWDFVSGRVVQTFPPLALRAEQAVYLNNDEVLLAWHNAPGARIELCVHSVRTGEKLRSMECSETSDITDMQASPDGTRIVVVGQHISLIDVQAGILLTRLGETEPAPAPGVPPGQVISTKKECSTPRVQFTSDSKTVMVLDETLETKFFDAVSGMACNTLTLATRHGGTLSGDGKTVAILNDDTQVFDLATRVLIPLPKPLEQDMKLLHKGAVSKSVWSRMSPDGLLAVALSSPQPRIFLWDTKARPVPVPRCILSRCTYATAMVFSRDGHTLAVLRHGTRPEFIDIKSGKTIGAPTTHLGDIAAMDVSTDGRLVAANDEAGSMSVWDLTTGKRLAFNDGGDYGIAVTPGALQFSTDNKSILMGGLTGTFEICESATLKTTRRLARPRPVNLPANTPPLNTVSTTISPDSRHYAQWIPGLNACIFDAQTASPVKQIQDHNPRAMLMQFSPDGQSLAIPVEDGLHLYSVDGGDPIIKHRDRLRTSTLARARFSPEGQQIVLADIASVTLWDTSATNDQPTGIIASFGTSEAEYDDLGGVLAVGDFPPAQGGAQGGLSHNFEVRNPSVSIYEPQTAKLIVRIPGMPAPVEAIRFVPHHPWLLTAGADANITQWDLLFFLHDPQLADTQMDQLWETLNDADPAIAYRAGAELARRGLLVKLAKSLPSAVSTTHDPNLIQQWIDDLSSPDNKKRENAHKRLEGAGAAAIPAVRKALAAHPGGEVEDRLSDIARIIGVDNNAPLEPENPDSNYTARSRRVVRLLQWMDDPDAKTEFARIRGVSSSQPTTSPLSTQPTGAGK